MAQMSKTKKPAGAFRTVRRMESSIPGADAAKHNLYTVGIQNTQSYHDKKYNTTAKKRDGGRLTSSATYKKKNDK